MKKFLLNAAAVLAFTANAYVLVESAVQLGTVIDQLIAGGYLKESQNRCPDGRSIVIIDGQAYAR